MNPLSKSSMQPSQPAPVPRWIFWTLAATSLVGFADAMFLSIQHFQNTIPPCVLFTGCETVTTSPYALIAGVPIAVLGALFYLAILVLSLVSLDRGARSLILKILVIFSSIGFLFTLWLLYLQLFVIHALCIYCILSCLTSTLIFILSLFGFRSFSRKSV